MIIPFTPFFQKFPDVAARETRVFVFPRRQGGLPADEYALVDFYCAEPGCDCRRVILQVWGQEKPGVSLATFNYGWESKEFYIQWMRGDTEGARDMHGLTLEPFGPQSAFTEPLRALVQMLITEDRAYVARLKRHYEMIKAAQKGPGR